MGAVVLILNFEKDWVVMGFVGGIVRVAKRCR